MTTNQTPQFPRKQTTCALTILLLASFTETARAEVPFDPPGTYSTSWLGNTYMDAAYGMTVPQRANGEYIVLFENAAWAHIQMYRWCPSGTCASTPSVSAAPMFSGPEFKS